MHKRIIIGLIIAVITLGMGLYVIAQEAEEIPAFVVGQVLTADELNALGDAIKELFTSLGLVQADVATITANIDQSQTDITANNTAISELQADVATNTAVIDQSQADIAANSAAIDTTPQTFSVNCTDGDTLGAAIVQAKPGDTIQVTGTCTETVTITTDDLTIEGQDGAVIDGGGGFDPGNVWHGVITVDGARRVTIKTLIVRNGPDGILAYRGAAVILEGVTAENNADEGIQIDENSTGTITDCTAQNNGDRGILVNRASSGIFQGSITSTGNGTGIRISEASSGVAPTRTPGTVITTNQNDTIGVSVRANSVFTVNSGTTVETTQNTTDGLDTRWNSRISFFSGSTLNAEDNVNRGIFLRENSSLVLNGSSTIQNNAGDGVSVVRDSSVVLNNLVAQGNGGLGVLIEDSSVDLQNSTVTGNTGDDVFLGFAAKASLTGNTIGTIACDGTALSQGDTVCP